MVVAKVLLRIDLAQTADADVLPGPFAQISPPKVLEHPAMLSEDLPDRTVGSVFGEGDVLEAAAERVVVAYGGVVNP